MTTSFSPEVLARISELNRQVAADELPRVNSTPKRAQDLSTAVAALAPKSRQCASVTGQLPTGVEIETASGKCWRVRSTLDSLWRGAKRTVKRDGDLLRVCMQTQENPHPELKSLAAAFPNRTMFLDLETCGFAGATIFLVGLLHFEDGQLQLTQWLARNYAEEKAMLHAMWSTAHDCSVLVTFNGKSFDWPCVHDRSTLHHLGRPPADGDCPEAADTVCAMNAAIDPKQHRPQLVHCDLLHHSRRKWKDRLPNCKLQTLERYLFGRRRHDDIPGSEIPAAYHQFVRTGDAWEMRSVLHHNALDLITLLQLALKIAE